MFSDNIEASCGSFREQDPSRAYELLAALATDSVRKEHERFAKERVPQSFTGCRDFLGQEFVFSRALASRWKSRWKAPNLIL